jgi:hypothetical protein
MIFWRITPAHQINFSWYHIEQQGATALAQQVNIGPIQIPVNVGLNSELDQM